MKKIKKIITAIGNPILNNKLNIIEKIKIIGNDIAYREGIIETLEINNDIDFIIISELLPGNIDINELNEKIKEINEKIKIILIVEKNDFFDKYNLINIFRIINNKTNIDEIIKIINDDDNIQKYNLEIKKEIEELKKIINNNFSNELNNKNNKIKNNKIINLINNYFKKIKLINKNKIFKNIFNKKINYLKNNKLIKKISHNYLKKNIENNKFISIHGNNGAGKSTFTVLLANLLKEKNKKIIILDFDFLNNSLHTILGVKKYQEKIKNKINNINNFNEIKIENLIININKKIDLISGINIIFNLKNINKLNDLFYELKNNYDYIIVDTSSECFFDYTKKIMEISDKCFYITEANLSEISKSKRLLEIYENNWQIKNKKIKIIFNKYNKNCIDFNLLKKLYFNYEIYGKINLNKNNNFIYFPKKYFFIGKKLIKKLNLKEDKINLINN